MDTVWINGVAYPLTWTTLTNWTVTVPLTNGTNYLNIVGVDHTGQPIAGDSNQLTVIYSGTIPRRSDTWPSMKSCRTRLLPTRSIVELYNNSSNVTFDLSGWQLPGLAYTFPLRLPAAAAGFPGPGGQHARPLPRLTARPMQCLTRSMARSAPGQLLSLLQPSGGSNVVVAQVQFDDVLPWPTNASNPGVSLQLIDPRQDNWRAGNWSAGQTNIPPFVPQWVQSSATGTASSSTIYIYLQSAGDVYVDDIELVAGSVPGAGANVLPDGGFESGFPGPWVASTNLAASALSTTVKHSGAASLHVVSTSAGTTRSSAIYQDISPTLAASQPYALSYWYLQSTNGGPLTIRLSGSGIVDTVNPAPPLVLPAQIFTPDASNSVAATLTPFPPLWINEVEPDNLTGVTNSAGQRAPWIELYNPSANTVTLDGLYLADNYTNLGQWPFPSNAVISSGQFLVVFADGLTNLSITNQLHTSFVLPPASGSLALSRLADAQWQVLDYVNYTNLLPNYSYGSFPDGQSFARQVFYQPTPGGTNNGSSAPPPSFVPYLAAGSVYTQNFDALPDPGPSSVDSGNPVTIGGITYALSNPYDFAFPSSASGNNGGLGLPSLSGWFGLADPTASVGVRFGATDGDQTSGGQISFGPENGSNRALGLLATSTTGYTAFGLRLINGTGQTLKYINVQCTGAVWRQSNLAKTLECYYLIDSTATHSFTTNATALLPALNVNFPTVAADVGGAAVDGTATNNQTSLAVLNQPILDWPADAALWLVWEMASAAGKSQGLAIDNFSFSATAQATLSTVSMTAQASGTNVILNWPGLTGQMYEVQYKTNLTDAAWLPLNSPIPGTGASLSLTNNLGSAPQRFYRLAVLPP